MKKLNAKGTMLFIIISAVLVFLNGCATGQNSSVNIGNGYHDKQCKIEDVENNQ